MKQASRQSMLSFSFKRQAFDSLWLVGLFCFFGFLLSVTQIFGESPDYFNYNAFFDLVRRESLNTLAVSRFEPGFSLFAIFLTTLFTSNSIVYSCIVFTALLLKGWAIRTYSPSVSIFLVVAALYFVRYFPLHELTQLRAACAIALILVGAIAIWKGNFYSGTLICIISLAFHMSAAAIIPTLFIAASKRSKIIFISFIAFVVTSICAMLVTGYLASYIRILESYQTHGFADVKPNPFAIQLLIDWAIIIISFIVWGRLTALMKRIILIELIGMAIFYASIDLGIVVHRIREFYSVLWVFFVAEGLQQKSTKEFSYIIFLVFIIFYSYLFFINGVFFR